MYVCMYVCRYRQAGIWMCTNRDIKLYIHIYRREPYFSQGWRKLCSVSPPRTGLTWAAYREAIVPM